MPTFQSSIDVPFSPLSRPFGASSLGHRPCLRRSVHVTASEVGITRYLSSSGVGIEKRREGRGGRIRYGRENGPGGEEQNQ